jgi:hypothetical protein
LWSATITVSNPATMKVGRSTPSNEAAAAMLSQLIDDGRGHDPTLEGWPDIRLTFRSAECEGYLRLVHALSDQMEPAMEVR